MCWKTKMIWRRLPTGPPFKAISLNVDMIILDTTVYLYRHVSITIWEYAYRKTLYNVYHIICKCIFTAYLKIVVRQTNQSIAQRRTLKTTTKQTEVLPRVVVCNIGRVTTCKVNASEHATKRKQGCGGTSSSTNCSNNKTWHIQVESKKNKCVCKLNIQVSGKSLSQTIILHIISYHSIGSGCHDLSCSVVYICLNSGGHDQIDLIFPLTCQRIYSLHPSPTKSGNESKDEWAALKKKQTYHH